MALQFGALTRSVFLSEMNLTEPSVSAMARARELAMKGNLPTCGEGSER